MKVNKISRTWTKRVNLNIFLMLMVGIILIGCSSEKHQEAKTLAQCEVINNLPGDIKKAVMVNYGNKVKLLGITTNMISEDKLEIKYYWQLNAPLGKQNYVFVHISNLTGNLPDNILFQNDHQFCPQAETGQFVKETYVVSIPRSALGKEANISIGIYSFDPNIPLLDIISAEGARTDKSFKSFMGALVEKIKL